MYNLRTLVIFGVMLISPAILQAQSTGFQIDFEGAGAAAEVKSWQPAFPGVYDLQTGGAQSGQACLRIEPGQGREPAGFRAIRRSIDATPFRGQVLDLSAAIRNSVLAEKNLGWVGVEVRRPGHKRGLRASRRDAPVTEPDWTPNQVIFGVPADATTIEVTLFQSGAEPVWFDDISLKAIGRVGEGDYGEWITSLPLHVWNRSQTELVEMVSDELSAFWGRPIKIEAGVVVPEDYDGKEKLPICYNVHGFGGSHWGAWRRGDDLRAQMKAGYPRMVYVFLNASCSMGHHVFADSVNTGPWGSALVDEFIPEFEKLYGGVRETHQRFLTGHSSGGWSTLWLQVMYPKTFGGVWSTAPDPVDFRDFTNIDIYRDDNAYVDANGELRPLIRREGRVIASMKDFVQREESIAPFGGQMASFDAVFSPRGEDGRPMPLFDRKTGVLDREVARAWMAYDIGLILRENWSLMEPMLRGKIHVWMGTEDTFYLDGACRLLKADLEAFNSDADILMVEGRDHGSLFQPHPKLWPEGMMKRIHREMAAAAERGPGTGDAELDQFLSELDAELATIEEPKVVTAEDQGGT